VIVENIVMVASKENSLMGVELAPEPAAVDPSAPKWNAAVKWQTKDLYVNFSSPVAVGGYIYGLGPDKNLFCVETKTGRLMWSKEGFTIRSAEKAHLAIVVLGENLLLLTDSGELVLVAADPKEFKELGRVQVCGINWCNPAYADGKLFLRDGHELLCVDLLR
jgi:outer membrane protein assembly factor BamB